MLQITDGDLDAVDTQQLMDAVYRRFPVIFCVASVVARPEGDHHLGTLVKGADARVIVHLARKATRAAEEMAAVKGIQSEISGKNLRVFES